MKGKEHLVAWLNDAYSMELALIPILENHAQDAKAHPHLQQRILQHVSETRRHAEMIEQCVRQLGEETSPVKNILGSIFGNVQSIATGIYDDELVKNALMDYATENFEMAAYNALIVTAEELGYPQIASTCREILRDEEAMANFLETNLPTVVRDTIQSGVGSPQDVAQRSAEWK